MITKKDIKIYLCGIDCCGITIKHDQYHDVTITHKTLSIGCINICVIGKKEITTIQKIATRVIKQEHELNPEQYPETQKLRDKRIAHYMIAIKILVTEVRKNKYA